MKPTMFQLYQKLMDAVKEPDNVSLELAISSHIYKQIKDRKGRYYGYYGYIIIGHVCVHWKGRENLENDVNEAIARYQRN